VPRGGRKKVREVVFGGATGPRYQVHKRPPAWAAGPGPTDRRSGTPRLGWDL